MTLRYVDGFDYMPTGTGNDGRLEASGYYLRGGNGVQDVANIPNNIVSTGRFNYGNCLSWNGLVGSQANRLQMIKVIQPGSLFSAGVIGLAVAIGKTSTVPFQVCFYDAVTDQAQCYIEFLVNGIINAYGANGTFLARTYAGAYYFDEWFYCEFKASIATSGGTMEVRINTVPVIQIPSANTQTSTNASFDAFQLSTRSIGIGQKFVVAVDDLYVLDTGGSINNNFLGNVRVKTQFPSAPGSNTQFSIGGTQPTNWQAASNTNTDDTSYVFDPTVGQYDLYDIQAIINGPTVHGVQVRSSMRQDDSTQRVGHNQIQSGVTLANGPNDHYLNQSYTYYTDIWETDPNTSAGWTGTAVNALQIGPKVNA